jgi:hypothetical protein
MRPVPDMRARDGMLARVRTVKVLVAVAAAAATASLSVAAAHAFKGHDGHKRLQRATATPRRTHPAPAVNVPGPEHVPSIAGTPPPPQPLAAPAQAPSSAPAAPAQAPAAAPETSGGS